MKFGNRNILVYAGLVAVLMNMGGVNAQEQSHAIEIHAKRYAFVPTEITLKKGETVTLRLISDDVPHTLLVAGLKINSTMIKGHPSDITVTPETVGDFVGKCGRFCGSGHGSMLFKIHVKD